MKYSAAALALVAGASAHTLMSEIYVDGAPQGSGTCVRAPKNAKGAVDPIIDLGSNDMACGQDGDEGVARTCGMSAGQVLTFEYRQWPDDASRQSLAYAHMGPCSVYLKKVEDATKDKASGDGWFKLWDEGYDEGSGKWCTQQRINDGGKLSVTIPEALAGGDYLVRPELLALHNIPEKHQPEFYIGCAQLFIDSEGSSGPSETVSIPGHVSKEDGACTYNPFEKPLKPFTVPGPKVASLTSNYGAMSSKKQSDGTKPDNCLVTNNNWCGTSLPSYTDEDGCWKADKDCWAQLDKCYDTAGATGLEGCKVWQDYCKENQSGCKSGGSGPKNDGKSLQQSMETIKVPAAANGGESYGSSSGSNSGSDSKADSKSSSAAPSSSSAPQSSAPASYDNTSYKKKEVKQNNNEDKASSESAPQQTSVADYKPARSSKQAAPTTMATQVAPAPQKEDPNVVYETAYETVVAYATVTDSSVVYETAAPQHYRRHAHGRRHN